MYAKLKQKDHLPWRAKDLNYHTLYRVIKAEDSRDIGVIVVRIDDTLYTIYSPLQNTTELNGYVFQPWSCTISSGELDLDYQFEVYNGEVVLSNWYRI